jgi:oxygen-dependent protoporphyrinogen oxidase
MMGSLISREGIAVADDEPRRIVIIGGGISGLAAAERLTSLDPTLEIHLFEASDKLGGVLQTEHVAGYRLELGPDSILSRLPWGVELCQRVGLAEDLIGTNTAQSGVDVVCRGRLERIPAGIAIMAPQRLWPVVTSPILSWSGKARLAAEYFVPRRQSSDDESLAGFVRRRLGSEALERLVQPLAGGIYMGDPEALSIQAGFPQFVEMERKYGSLIKAARASKSEGQSTSGGPQYTMFVAPRKGMGQFVSAISERLVGCHVHLERQVEQIICEASGVWRVEHTDRGSGNRLALACQGVIVALPANRAAPVLASVDQKLGKLLAEIPYAGCVAVNMAFERQAVPHALDGFGFVAPHVERRSVLACTYSSVKYAGRAPDGKVLMRAFLGGACFPEVLEWPDEKILSAVSEDLRSLLNVRAEPLFTRIARWPETMPQYLVGHLQKVDRIEQLVGTIDGLEVAGNAYRGVGIPHCIRSGQQASERLVAVLYSRSPQSVR